MKTKFPSITLLFLLFCIGWPCAVMAQSKQMDTVTNYVPEFYLQDYTRVGDTVLKYIAYDSRDSIIKYIDDYEKVRYYSLFKEYTDSSHTYKDAKGVKQFLPISFITQRYDRLGKTRWMSVQYPGNKYTEYKDDRNNIAETKMLIIDTNGDNIGDLVKVMRYYKLVPVTY